MENEKMGAIDRALLFLAKATYENHGAGVDVRIVDCSFNAASTRDTV